MNIGTFRRPKLWHLQAGGGSINAMDIPPEPPDPGLAASSKIRPKTSISSIIIAAVIATPNPISLSHFTSKNTHRSTLHRAFQQAISVHPPVVQLPSAYRTKKSTTAAATHVVRKPHILPFSEASAGHPPPTLAPPPSHPTQNHTATPPINTTGTTTPAYLSQDAPTFSTKESYIMSIGRFPFTNPPTYVPTPPPQNSNTAATATHSHFTKLKSHRNNPIINPP